MDRVEVPEIDEGLVRGLLREQHPDIAELDLEPLDSGWDNSIFRLGSELTVRLPRRVEAAHLIDHEHRWLPSVVRAVPAAAAGGVDVTTPLRTGRPGLGYPWSWSVCPWFPGEIAALAPPVDPLDAARRLGRFLRAIHRPARDEFPPNPFRGVPLADRTERLVASLQEVVERGRRLPRGVSEEDVLARWEQHLETPPWDGPPTWLHGDLHPCNLLVHEGVLTAVIDFGDMTAGDPATDLAVAWLLLPPVARTELRLVAGGATMVDDATWRRAEAWALALSVAYLAGAPDDSPLLDVTTRILPELATLPED